LGRVKIGRVATRLLMTRIKHDKYTRRGKYLRGRVFKNRKGGRKQVNGVGGVKEWVWVGV
jgi:hypothetical protein